MNELCYFSATEILKRIQNESAWLKKEMKQSTVSSKRQINYLSSQVFAKYWLKDRIAFMLRLLNENRSNGISLKKETINWLDIALILDSDSSTFNDNLSVLIKDNVISRNGLEKIYGIETPYGIYSFYKIFGKEIIEKVVVDAIQSM